MPDVTAWKYLFQVLQQSFAEEIVFVKRAIILLLYVLNLQKLYLKWAHY